MLIEGYYVMNHVVYYGCFDDEDISGYMVISRGKIDSSCKSLPKDNRAYLLIDNNAATSQQIQFILECISIIKKASKDMVL